MAVSPRWVQRVAAVRDRIADHTGHKAVPMAGVYARRPDAFADNPEEGLL